MSTAASGALLGLPGVPQGHTPGFARGSQQMRKHACSFACLSYGCGRSDRSLLLRTAVEVADCLPATEDGLPGALPGVVHSEGT